MHPFHVCTILKSKFSRRNFPKGLRRLKIISRKKPATVGGSTRGIVRIPSNTALVTGFIFIIFLAHQIPRKNAMVVATAPVFKEIHKGDQLISCINSLIIHSPMYRALANSYFYVTLLFSPAQWKLPRFLLLLSQFSDLPVYLPLPLCRSLPLQQYKG